MKLVNVFHETEYFTRKTVGELTAINFRLGWEVASNADKALERKIRRALCGVKDCQCSGSFGIRE